MRIDAPAGGPLSDEARLAQLGYKQELRRKLSGFSNFAVSFSIISILAGCLTSYGIAMKSSGCCSSCCCSCSRPRARST